MDLELERVEHVDGQASMFADDTDTQPSMFPGLVPVESALAPGEKLSAQRRLTIRQHNDIAAGRHPLTHGPLHRNRDLTCGECAFRGAVGGHTRDYPKCHAHDGARIAHSAASDVRAWWPACPDWQP